MLKVNSIYQTLNFSAASGTLVSSDILLQQSVSGSGILSGLDVYDSGYFIIQTGTAVSAGAIGVQIVALSPVGNPNWITATTSNSPTGAAFSLIPTLGASLTYMGSLGVTGGVFFPCSGLRLTVSGLTGGSITLAQLTLTKR